MPGCALICARATKAKETFAKVRRAADVRAQIKAHPGITIGVSAAATIALGLGVWITIARARERRRPLNRLKGRIIAYRALLANPHRALHHHEPIPKRLLAAVLVAGATTIVRSLSLLLVKRTVEPRMLPPERRMLPSRHGSTARE
jgi:hypothetical protein